MMSTILLDHHVATRDARNSIFRIYFTDIADDKTIVIDIYENIYIDFYISQNGKKKKEKNQNLFVNWITSA